MLEVNPPTVGVEAGTICHSAAISACGPTLRGKREAVSQWQPGGGMLGSGIEGGGLMTSELCMELESRERV